MDSAAWSDHLAAVAEPVLRGTPLDPKAQDSTAGTAAFIDAFADELGHRRRVDRPLLRWMLGPLDREGAPGGGPASPDEALWWALIMGGAIDGHIHPIGPVTGEPAFAHGAIEAATETELASLHALWHHADREQDAERRSALLDRVLDAARWHVDTLQPDNGTNHPWAVHVFVGLSEADGAYGASASLHAQSLLHNAIVRTGTPDRFSACLLLDASRALRSRD